MVPGSTLRYGSHFCRLTLKPRLSRRQPMEEAATPLPSEETTPPVTNIYFGAIRVARAVTRFTAPDFSYLSGEGFVSSPQGGFQGLDVQALNSVDVHTIMNITGPAVNSNSWRLCIDNFCCRATFLQGPGS